MAPHSSTLAWIIPWTEKPGGLQSMGLLRVGHDWATSLSCIGKRNGNPLQCSCLENPRGGGAWWPAVYGVAQNRTRLSNWTELTEINFQIFFLFLFWCWNPGNSRIVAFETILREVSGVGYVYSYNWFMMLYRGNQHNMVQQPPSN